MFLMGICGFLERFVAGYAYWFVLAMVFGFCFAGLGVGAFDGIAGF